MKKRFIRNCPVAIDPKSFGPFGTEYDYDDAPQAAAEAFTDDVAYVTIRGPLSHHDEWWFESYDAIVARMREAFASQAKVVFVSGDTPGGDVSGCFDTARELRRLADESGKLFVWYVDGMTCSAGLALAVAADYIIVPEEGRFGSIGVIAEIHSHKRQSEQWGVDSELVTSGDYKADGHPLSDITKDVVARVRASVNYEADIFFQWVSERRGIPVETIRSWQAGIFHGQQAVDIGLADEVAGESAALAMVAGAELTDAPTGAESDSEMKPKLVAAARAALGLPAPKAVVASSASNDLDSIRKSLGRKAAEDSDDGRSARRALEALDKKDEDEAESEDTDDEKPKHDEPDGDEGSAETDEDASAAESEDDDSEASAAETDEDASAAESEDDAKKCEADAKKAEAEAADEDAKALAAIGGKDGAKLAKAHMLAAKRLRASASSLRREAQSHRRVSAQNKVIVQQAAAIDELRTEVTRMKKSIKPNASVAAMSARGTRGASQQTRQGNSANVSDLSMFDADERRRLRLGNVDETALIEEHDGEPAMGFLTPTQAASALKTINDVESRVAKLGKGGK